MNLWGEKAEMELAAMSLAVSDISMEGAEGVEGTERLRDVKHFATEENFQVQICGIPRPSD